MNNTVVLRESIEVPVPPRQAFEYVAAWENIAEWDPGVATARRTEGGVAPEVGASYDLELQVGPRRVPMKYLITTLEAPHQIVLEGTGDSVRAVDTITFSPSADGTRIDYEAELTFTGLAGLLTRVMGRRLDRIGTDAVEGLRRRLVAIGSQDAR